MHHIVHTVLITAIKEVKARLDRQVNASYLACLVPPFSTQLTLNGSKPYISSNGIKPVFLGEDNGSSGFDKFYYCAIGISFTAMWPGVITLQIPQSLALLFICV